VASSLAAVDHEGVLRLWDIRSPSLPLTSLILHEEKKGLALCMDKEGKTMFAGGEGGSIKSFHLAE